MREILFRGKRKDNNEWIYRYYCRYGYVTQEKTFIIPDYASALYATEVIPETVGQYTGLPDKNGKKIFEGDIVKAYKHNEIPFTQVVTFKHGCFWFGNWNWLEFINVFRNFEVIGNIHDNHELLKEQDK